MSNYRRKVYNKGRWSDEEKCLFLVGLQRFGRGKWREIGTVLTTRSSVQIKSHGQKLCDKQEQGVDIFAPLKKYYATTNKSTKDDSKKDKPSISHIVSTISSNMNNSNSDWDPFRLDAPGQQQHQQRIFSFTPPTKTKATRDGCDSSAASPFNSLTAASVLCNLRVTIERQEEEERRQKQQQQHNQQTEEVGPKQLVFEKLIDTPSINDTPLSINHVPDWSIADTPSPRQHEVDSTFGPNFLLELYPLSPPTTPARVSPTYPI
eukprot:CAMPEP_0202446382 /NCGR_PEP_ID=MMETSP1360-20130828/4879_1 /ASSEMBLY_ACC=CAM_ASM_000848 /TAXON_ID=515479 /ORGANISM="Licmophora paradoxa, Strain CCMP2313" /LENGTH=262 /DNA_ID=CAMNT_0049062835 /DNA_START=800 /DNA_END=1588 /DNA_ORIENTATION=-